ncbi:MAG: hypothetical protein JNM51_14520 [Bacteroidia bacterium]|nr:hypothetical protein [Bacteroidia bacterium]
MSSLSPQKKKIPYKVSSELNKYLMETGRIQKIPVQYQDLLRFTNSINLYDKYGKDTLWLTVAYSQNEMEELHKELTNIYATLKTNGDVKVMEHLHVERIDFCTFGNSKPFRIKIVNNYNDNYDYYYIKLADSSRIYGLEWEHILSPNRINYFVNEETLVEEHIVGIPGDQFIKNNFNDPELNQIRLAKEFVKFNERCFVRLLGDMRSYNYVIDVTPDFEDTQYRIRAIDFDQQSFEGRKSLYIPQYFKENLPYVELCMKHLNTNTVKQYQSEERSLIARRIRTSKYRVNQLLEVMKKDSLSTPEKIKTLKEELSKHYEIQSFMDCKSMGELMEKNLQLLLTND